MISALAEKKLLQITVALACIVPISAGICGAILGSDFLGVSTVNVDSHFRYLSGLLLAIGLCFLKTIPNIENNSALFRTLTIIVLIGGIARVLGFFLAGMPDTSMVLAAIMELMITPLLCLWQHRLASRF